MTINIENGKAYIVTPYNPDFIKKVKNIGGRWDAGRKAWAVKESMVEEAREIMRAVYGKDDTQNDIATTDIRIRFNELVTGERKSIILFGKTIATAWGRDSGARVGEDVAFIKDEPYSGGSVKNWKTIIDKGAEIVIKNVPVTLLDSELPRGVEILKDNESEREELLIQKAKLEAMLEEVNKKLSAL